MALGAGGKCGSEEGVCADLYANFYMHS